MSDMKATLVDIDKIYAFVDELKEVDKAKAIRGGLLQGAKVLERAGRRSLRASNNEHSGNLMKSIRAKLARKGLRAYAGFERSWKFQLEKGVGNHAHLVDKGTKRRYTKGGAYRGIMPASYFWTSAVQASTPSVNKAIESGVLNWVQDLKERHV